MSTNVLTSPCLLACLSCTLKKSFFLKENEGAEFFLLKGSSGSFIAKSLHAHLHLELLPVYCQGLQPEKVCCIMP